MWRNYSELFCLSDMIAYSQENKNLFCFLRSCIIITERSFDWLLVYLSEEKIRLVGTVKEDRKQFYLFCCFLKETETSLFPPFSSPVLELLFFSRKLLARKTLLIASWLQLEAKSIGHNHKQLYGTNSPSNFKSWSFVLLEEMYSFSSFSQCFRITRKWQLLIVLPSKSKITHWKKSFL